MIPLNEQAYRHLQKMILEGQLMTGTVYSETKFSKELGISRTPFRDAVHRLAQEGYLDIIPSKGFVLHQMNQKEINEIFQLRSALECYCTMQIASAPQMERSKQLFAALNAVVCDMKKILETTQSIRNFCDYDFQYHTMIIDFLENKEFTSIFSSCIYRMRKLAESSLAHEGRMRDTYEEHLAILRAMEQGDVEHIYAITRRHMENPWKINLEDL